VPDENAATLTIVVSLFMALLLLVTALLTLRSTSITPCSFMSWLLQLLAILMFFFGDKAPYVVHRYGNELNCSNTCQSYVQSAAIFSLAVGLFILNNIPLLYRDKSKGHGARYTQRWWEHAFSMITIFLGTDLMYSLLMAFTFISDESTPKSILSTSFLVVLILIGCTSIVINCCYVQTSALISRNKNRRKKCDASLSLVTIFLVASLPFYLLSDNVDPFFSIAGCTPTATTPAVGQSEDCNIKNVKILRIFLMLIPGAAIVFAFVVFSCKWCDDGDRDDDGYEEDKEA